MTSHPAKSQTVNLLKEVEHSAIAFVSQGGRRTKDYLMTHTRDELRAAALPASRLLYEFVLGERVKHLSRTRLDACIFVIEQVLGKAKQRVEHDVDSDTYDALVRLASEHRKAQDAGKALPALVPAPPDPSIIEGSFTAPTEPAITEHHEL